MVSTLIASSQGTSDEIIFYSTKDVFAPLITLSGKASVRWTWDDNTTDTITNPVKNYGSDGLRKNYLKVTPWSALQMINIGYDAGR